MNTETGKINVQTIREENLKKLYKTFPSLREYKDRWGTVYYSADEINERVNEVEFRHHCGCCHDSKLFAYFYQILQGYKVYANPYKIEIGYAYDYGSGDIPYDNWRSKLREYQIPETLDQKIEEYFACHRPANIDSDSFQE